MARIKNNFAMEGMTGKIGNIFVYRHRNGKTIVSKTPNKTAPLSEKQKGQTQRFKLAINYAKSALLDTTLKEYYETEAKKKQNVSAYNVAVADYLTSPIINNIDYSGYTGDVTNQKIIIELDNNTKVIKVSVKIIAKDKSTLEEGEATLLKGKWQYTTTSVNATIQGTKIIVSATDRPNNTTKKEITL